MKKIKRKFKSPALLVLAAFLGLAFLLSLLSPTSAAGARLFLSPSSGNYRVGSYISVDVLVDTQGSRTNAYKAVLTYPTEKLTVVSASSGGSICSLWIPPTPNYSNEQGTATFECGSTEPFRGSKGKIGTLTFLVQETGKATVSISDGEVKRADGAGSEILSSREAASFELQETPEGVPSISSSTHPDQNSWYQEKTVELSWEGEGEFSYLLNQKPKTDPDNEAEGEKTEKTYESVDDGVWYFHLKSRSPDGWGETAHFIIQIDTKPPQNLVIVSDPPAERVFRAPTISFVATDSLSGVDHYELALDDKEFKETSSPYRFERIRSGIHKVSVRAYDRAGNTKEGEITLNVVSVRAPEIIRPEEGKSIPLFSPVNIEVRSNTSGTVELSLDEKTFATLDVEAGATKTHTLKKAMLPGGHKIQAVLVNADGIESAPEKVGFNVDAARVYLFGLILPGYIVYSILLLTLILLTAFSIVFIKRRRKKKVKKKKKEKKQKDEKKERKEK